MVDEGTKQDNISYAIAGRFDAKAALGLSEKLRQAITKKSASGLMLDFSSATHITADGMAALKQLSERIEADGKTIIVGGMSSELYKALKIAGISEAMQFTHRSSHQASL